MHNENVMPETVRGVVRALCADYERRRDAIERHTVTPRTENEYKYYNYKILDAVVGFVGASDAEEMIMDIGLSRGYSKSEISAFAETAYKYKKGGAVISIAKSLHLID